MTSPATTTALPHTGNPPEESGSPPEPAAPLEQIQAFSAEAQEHLAELRSRLMISAAALGLAMAGGFYLHKPVLNWMQTLAGQPGIQFIQQTPGELFGVSMKLSLALGLLMAGPVVLYQLACFVMPGLTAREKSLVLGVTVLGALLLLFGLWMAQWAIIPQTLSFFWQFGHGTSVKTMISIGAYVDCCLMLFAISGLVCQLPSVLVLLGSLGIINSVMITQRWREAIIISLIVAAVITPSQDPLSMIVVGVLLVGLLGLSVAILRLMGR